MKFLAALELGKLPLKTTAKPGNFSGEFPSNLSWGVTSRMGSRGTEFRGCQQAQATGVIKGEPQL
jgi:hypothetical protein